MEYAVEDLKGSMMSIDRVGSCRLGMRATSFKQMTTMMW